MTSQTVEQAMLVIEHQQRVFAEKLRRADLLRATMMPSRDARPLRLRVHRNCSFEFIGSVLQPFLTLIDRRLECAVGDYDDSLSLLLTGDADLELIWLDLDRYQLSDDELLVWLNERILHLRTGSKAPILIAAMTNNDLTGRNIHRKLHERCAPLPGVFVLPLHEILSALGTDAHDTRMSRVGATRLSEQANLEIARHMGLRWLPAVLGPRLKAVIFDLDNTLWGGVLGEDGLGGVIIDEPYAALHAKATGLAEDGLFLGLLSRNESVDVDAMLASGRMGQLPEKISARSIGWNSKALGMKQIADALRIGYDAILFVDDNPGELAAVSAACPGTRLLLAGPDPHSTILSLDFYPGLFNWGSNSTDALRAKDLATNDARTALRGEASNEQDYLASLQLVIRIAVDPASHRPRLQQLSEKTNQFNLALRRLSEIDVDEALNDPCKAVVGIWLTDRFSDSGLIGILLARLDDAGRLQVEELCISCRALGRGIEDAMIVAALSAAIENIERTAGVHIPVVGMSYVLGPRNEPARAWLEKFSGQALNEHGVVILPWNAEAYAAKVRDLPIRIEQGVPDAI